MPRGENPIVQLPHCRVRYGRRSISSRVSWGATSPKEKDERTKSQHDEGNHGGDGAFRRHGCLGVALASRDH